MWRAYERWGILPPGIKADSTDSWTIAMLVGYEEVRQLEENPPDPKTRGK